MNVLYGLYRADEGEILLDDEVQHFAGPGDAIAAGIGMVHQHFMLVPVFTVAENVMLGNEATGFAGSLDLDAARERVRTSPNASASTSTPTRSSKTSPSGSSSGSRSSRRSPATPRCWSSTSRPRCSRRRRPTS